MKPGDLVYPWSYNDDHTIALYLGDDKTYTFGTESKIFWNGYVTTIPKHQLRVVNEKR